MSFAIEVKRGKGKKKGVMGKEQGARSKEKGRRGERENHSGLQDCKTAGPFTRRAIGNQVTNS